MTVPESAPAVSSPEVWDAVVVGGGVAGLVVARELAIRGLRTVVLDASDHLGGPVVGHEVAGLRLDAGAESFATRGSAVADLARELGLGPDLTAPSGLGSWVYLKNGRASTLPRAGVLGIPARPWALDVVRTIGVIGALRASLDRLLPLSVGTRGKPGAPDAPAPVMLGELVRARMGRRVLERLVAPVVGGVHAADPNTLDTEAVAPGLLAGVARHGSLGAAVGAQRSLAPAGSAVAGIIGGMHVLAEALVADLHDRGVEMRTGVRVTAVGRTAVERETDTGWVVRTTVDGVVPTDGSLRAGSVVLAVPGPTALELLRTALPEATLTLAGRHADAGSDVVLATLVLDAPGLDDAPRGTGVLVAPGTPGVRAKALTHGTAKWSWLTERVNAAGRENDARHGWQVVRLSYGRGGESSQDAVSADEDTLTDWALADASALLGVPLDRSHLVGFARRQWSQSLPQHGPDHQSLVLGVRTAVAGALGLDVTGAWIAGTGLTSVVADAQIVGRSVEGSAHRSAAVSTEPDEQ